MAYRGFYHLIESGSILRVPRLHGEMFGLLPVTETESNDALLNLGRDK